MQYTNVIKVVCLVCISLMVGFSMSEAADVPEVSVELTAILASYEAPFIDPELQTIADEIKTVFTFTSFKKIKKYTVLLVGTQSDRIALPEAHDLIIECRGIDEKGSIDLTVSMGEDLNTDFSVINGGHIVIGGPELKKGTLILLIEAET